MKLVFVASMFALLMFIACKPAVSKIGGAELNSTLASAPPATTKVSSDFDLAEDPNPDTDLK